MTTDPAPPPRTHQGPSGSGAPTVDWRSVVDTLAAAVVVLDTDATVVAANDTWPLETDPDGNARPTTYEALCAAQVGADAAGRLRAAVAVVLHGDDDHHQDDLELGSPGEPRWLHVEVVAHTDALGRRGAVVTHTDITQHRESEERLRWLADHDRLTGLVNRHGMVRELTAAISASSTDEALGVVLVDVVSSDRVQSALRGVMNDRLLRDVALRLVSTIGDRGTAAIGDGDQFVLLVPGTSRAELVALTSQVAATLAQPFRTDGRTGQVTGTQGVTLVADPMTSAEDVMGEASTALLHVRTTRGAVRSNRVAFFDEAMRATLVRRTEIEVALRRAIDDDDLHLVYQPVVDLTTGRVASAEALLRWIRPYHGFVAPEDFVSVAEEAGLMADLGSWVLRTAMAQAAEWDAAGHPVPVSVNVSVDQLAPSLVEDVGALLAAHHLPANRLVLEVTEAAVMADPATGVATLEALRALGCRVAMDNYGTGRSSLANLKTLPIHLVKLDQAFVAGVTEGHSVDGSIVAAVLELTEALGLIAVAEGVETTAQAEHLLRLGCRFAQGYLFSPPRDPNAMIELLDHGIDWAAAVPHPG